MLNISVWGLAAFCLLSINVLLVLYGIEITIIMIMGAPYLVFEALIGPWLMVKGIRDGSETK